MSSTESVIARNHPASSGLSGVTQPVEPVVVDVRACVCGVGW